MLVPALLEWIVTSKNWRMDVWECVDKEYDLRGNGGPALVLFVVKSAENVD
jgi:hypothetical protein